MAEISGYHFMREIKSLFFAKCNLRGNFSRRFHKQRIFIWCSRTWGWHSAAGQRVRRRILRVDIAGGGLGGASGTASAVRHGRSGEVQAALYTGAQSIGGHYREFPDETSNFYRPLNRSSGIRSSSIYSQFLDAPVNKNFSRIKFTRRKKALPRKHHAIRKLKLSVCTRGASL